MDATAFRERPRVRSARLTLAVVRNRRRAVYLAANDHAGWGLIVLAIVVA